MKPKIAFLFPGQGAQYSKMGKDFYDNFPIARQTFEEADDLLQRPLSRLIFEGTEEELTQTKNSQPAIFTVSYAILKTINQLLPELKPSHTAGLSLGEYTALTAANIISYQQALPLVQARGQFMHDCCENHPGTMAVVLGLTDELVEDVVASLQLPNDLWAANFNCPGQVVISGTKKGVEIGSKALSEKGAKRILPLQVHGAFHSGLMKEAKVKLQERLSQTKFTSSDIQVAMNVTGKFAADCVEIQKLLTEQVTSPVRWHNAVSTIDKDGVQLFLEIGCGKTLSGMNKRIGIEKETINIDKVGDLDNLESKLQGYTL